VTWAVEFKCHDQRDGYYETYALVEQFSDTQVPGDCLEMRFIRTSHNTVAQSVFKQAASERRTVEDGRP
jgi:hypothetical protein